MGELLGLQWPAITDKTKVIVPVHYVPLHSAPGGLKFGRFDGKDGYTTKESERLVRLPMYYGLQPTERDKVIAAVKEFFK